MAAFSFLGDELITKTGRVATADLLADREYVLLYFSASWCPPCQRFTPQLAEFYKAHKEAKKLEVVFVSGDKDEAAMQEYYDAKMPWAAIPFEAAARKACSSKYSGDGIPDLCIFDRAGAVVKQGAVQNVREDAEGASFPWPPPTWEQCLPATLLKKDGSAVSKDTLQGKTVGVYCSAHWCPPCRAFTPELAKFYEAYKKLDPDFEIIFCSSDRTKEDMQSYFTEAHGDYLCIEYDAKERALMKELVDADGIPTFAVYSADGKLVNKSGRSKVDAGAEAVHKDGWAPPVLGDLSLGTEAAGQDLNSVLSVIVNVEGCDDDTQEAAGEVLLTMATAAVEKAGEGGAPEVIFFLSKKASSIGTRIAELTQGQGSKRCAAPGNEPLMLAFNISDNGAFFESAETDVTAESVQKFIDEVNGGQAARLQLE